ncbi:hypothetical protein BH11BAC1_BH11BAC1_27160 [soil metagenome]
MKKSSLIILLSCITLFTSAQQPVFNWAKNNGEIGQSIACDAVGNTYVTGWFGGTVDFDPGAGVSNLVSAGNVDIFLAKYNASGNFVFAKRFGSTNVDIGLTIKVDLTGNINIAGSFMGTVDFDAGAGNFSLTASGTSGDAFIAQYSNAGTFNWAFKIGSSGLDQVRSLTCDASGNVYVTGHFQNSPDFNPSSAVNTLSSSGSSDIFFAKYSLTGQFIFANKIGASDDDQGVAICVDASENIYLTGSFRLTVDFIPTSGVFNLTSAGGSDIFIAIYNGSGIFRTAKRIGGSGNEYGPNISITPANRLYVSGLIESASDMDPGNGSTIFTPVGNDDSFFMQLDNLGNFNWAKQLSSSTDLLVRDITSDRNENVYIGGSFESSVDFDPGAGVSVLTPIGDKDAFYAKYNSAGNIIYAKKIGSSDVDGVYGLAADQQNNLFVMGAFGSTADFDPSPSTFNLSPGANFGFVAKFSHVSPLPVELIMFTASFIKENVIQCDWTTLTEVNNDYFTIERSVDGEYFAEVGKINGVGNSTVSTSYELDDEQPIQGTSYYRLKQTDFDGRFTYSQTVSVKTISNIDFIAYPNPATTVVRLLFNSNIESDYGVQMVDAVGRICLQQNGTHQNGIGSVEINTSKLSPGIYQLIFSEEDTSTSKIISIR